MFGVVSVLAAGTQPAQERRMENEKTFQQMFPQGEPLPEQFSKYFTGQAWLARLTTDAALNVPVSNVTFSPGCRNNWHSHTGGQLLIAVGGRGYYQEKGRPARELLPGDVVEIAPDVMHWHGAAPDSWFSHLAVECNPATNVNTWLEPVDDAQYDAATASRPVFSEGIPVDGAKDPELFEIFDNFVLGEVLGHGGLDARTRLMCILASNVASQGRAAFRAALGAGVTPVEVKEVLYQAVPYVGMAKVADFIGAANDVLEARGVGLRGKVRLLVLHLDRPLRRDGRRGVTDVGLRHVRDERAGGLLRQAGSPVPQLSHRRPQLRPPRPGAGDRQLPHTL